MAPPIFSKRFYLKNIFLLIFMFIFIQNTFGQFFYIVGPRYVAPGSTVTYEIRSLCGPLTLNWTSIPGAISYSPSSTSITIHWGCAPSHNQVNGNFSCPHFAGSFYFYIDINASNANYPINGPSEVCPGANNNFTFPTYPGATGYQWSVSAGTGNGVVPPINTSAASIHLGTSGQVTMTVNAGGCTYSYSKSVNVVNLINPGAISGPLTVCGGTQNLNYQASNSTPGIKYLWTVPQGAIITNNTATGMTHIGNQIYYDNHININYDPYASSGDITCQAFKYDIISNTVSCPGPSSSCHVNINPYPTLSSIHGQATICQGSSSTFSVDPQANTSYSWSLNPSIGTISPGPLPNSISINSWTGTGAATLTCHACNSNCLNTSGVNRTINLQVYPNNTSAIVSSHTYNHSELNTGPQQVLTVNHCFGCITSCSGVNKEIDKSTLIAKLDLGDDYNFGTNPFNTSVTLDIKGYASNNGTGTQLIEYTKTLSLDQAHPEEIFSKDFTQLYTQINSFRVSTSGYVSNSLVQNNIRLKVYYDEKFKYDVSNTNSSAINQFATPALVASSNQVLFKWGPCTHFPNYEIQILRLFPNLSNHDIVDWNKALDIETQSADTFIVLSLTEGSGNYIWRVRPIGNYYAGGIANNQNWGWWTDAGIFLQDADVALNSPTLTQHYYFAYTQFDDDKNWIYSRTFTEGSVDQSEQVRIAEQITYANGLQQVQQEQAHMQSGNKILVTQTVNDFAGRPSFKTMPVPAVNSNSLGYINQFIKNFSHNLYLAGDFDSNGDYNNPGGVDSSANNSFSYYSDLGSDINVPSSEGYPFTRTLYYPDGTNRVKEQAGAGKVHTLTSNPLKVKTIRTYYSVPADGELIRVLGDEAPDAASVQKVITVDANQVASVSYISKEGNTIITCLGINGQNNYNDNTSSLDGLPSQADAGFTVNDTIHGNIPVSHGLQSSKTVSFLQATTITLNYSITPKMVKAICNNFCYTCDYKVYFTVKDVNDPDHFILFDSIVIPPSICSSSVNPVLFTKILPLLPAGSYVVTRIIKTENTDPATVGPPPLSSIGNTYLEENLLTLGHDYDNLFITKLASVNSYLNQNDIEGLYQFLGVDIHIPDAEHVFQDSVVHFNVGCDEIGIPIITCHHNPCPPGITDFRDYLTNRWPHGFASHIESLNYFIQGTTYLHYTNTADFDDFIQNMINDGYNCDSMWSCWENIVQSLNVFNGMSPIPSGYRFDLVNQFLNCMGRRFIAGTNDMNLIKHFPYKYFYYDDFNHPNANCESAILGVQHPLPIQWSTYSDSILYIFYQCINSPTNTPPDPHSSAQVMEDSCNSYCESRRESFVNQLILMYHKRDQYVEHDIYMLVPDNGYYGNTYVPDPHQTIQAYVEAGGTTPDMIPWSQITCMANSLVENCKRGCKMTVYDTDGDGHVDSVGSQAELMAMIESMTYSFQVDLPDPSSKLCPEGFETISAQNTAATTIKAFDARFGSGFNDKCGGILQRIVRGTGEGSKGPYNYVLYGETDNPPNSTPVYDETDACYGGHDFWVMGVNGNGAKVWDYTFGGSDIDEAVTGCLDNVGNFLIGGSSKSQPVSVSGIGNKTSPNPINSYSDYWIIKLDEYGNKIFDNTYRCIDCEYAYIRDIISTSDGGFAFVGYYFDGSVGNYSGMVYKVDQAGNTQWTIQMELPRQSDEILFNSIRQTQDGGYIIGAATNCDRFTCTNNPRGVYGKSQDTYNGNGKFDYWVIKLDQNGLQQWDKTIGGDKDDYGYNIELANNGGYIIAGKSNSNSGSIKTDNCVGDDDIWVVKMDASGNVQWNKTYGGNSKDGSGEPWNYDKIVITPSTANGYVIGASSNSPVSGSKSHDPCGAGGTNNNDFWVINIDNSGNKIWDLTLGGDGSDNLANVKMDLDPGWLVAVGTSDSPVSGDKSQVAQNNSKDYWMIKFKGNAPCDHPDFCFRWVPPYKPADSLVYVFTPYTCEEVAANNIRNSIEQQIYELKNHYLEKYDSLYHETCFNPDSIDDRFWLGYPLGYHHYTLYYYDRAGNLIKTVPPKGVIPLNLTALDLARQTPTNHQLVTDYKYNSLKQLVRQHTPDGGETKFYYNAIGQLRFSQNAEQLTPSVSQPQPQFSYTKYDALGRIIEIGQSTGTAALFSTVLNLNNPNFPTTGSSQRTYTVYSTPFAGLTYLNGFTQRYIENRVSYSYTDDGAYTYYSYDPHGNVDWIVQDIPELGREYVAYQYDLVSNKVIMVKYNEGLVDAFYHRYSYDSDNRIIKVETSKDNIVWDSDAKYQYYSHGPLKRMELGEDKIQGVDYTYTLQGWLKGINHPSLLSGNDPGNDTTISGNHFANDVFGMQLGYYNGDFSRAGSKFTSSSTYMFEPSSSPNRNLYNGNISTWASNIQNPPGGSLFIPKHPGLTGSQFRYDELNRILKSDYKDFNGTNYAATNDYHTQYTFDANGNFISLNRTGYSTNMDALAYSYVANTNQLQSVVDDPALSANYGTDIDGTNNYYYDKIGNLNQDIGSSIQNIGWSVYGKVKSVTKTTASTLDNLQFLYDASGNRITKIQIHPADAMQNLNTYYVRDAQGNLLSVYNKSYQTYAGGYKEIFWLNEQPIYGSSRVGERNDSIVVKIIDHPTGGTVSNVNANLNIVNEQTNLLQVELGPMQFQRIGFNVFNLPWGGNLSFPIYGYLNNSRIQTMNVPSGGSSSVGNPVFSFAGKPSKNVAVAEDENGTLLFSAFTAESYNNVPNVCLVLNKNYNLMAGQSGIKSNHLGRSIVIKKPGSDHEYYLFTTDNLNHVYYHVIDMSLNSGLGGVVNKNIPLDVSFTYAYCMAAIEDNSGLGVTGLYMMRINTPSGNGQLVRFPITSSGVLAPITLSSFSASDFSILSPTFESELQVSPEGKKLVLNCQRRTRFGLAFARYLIFSLSSDYSNVLSVQTILNAPTEAGAMSVDFSPTGRYIYYTGSRSVTIHRYDVINNTRSTSITSSSVNMIRRGKNGIMYAGLNSNSQSLLSLANPDGATIPTASNFTVSTSTDYNLIGTLQLQPHRIFTRSNNDLYVRGLGKKEYELTDHLGNVTAVVSDIKMSDVTGGIPHGFYADMKGYYSYYPYGMLMPGRYWPGNDVSNGNYRFGFNGKEKDDEMKASAGNSYDFGARIYDPRVGKFLSIDAEFKNAPGWSPFRFGADNPIIFIDKNGDYEVSPTLLQQYPKVAILIQNFENIYCGNELPADVAAMVKGVDFKKIFNNKLLPAMIENSTLDQTTLENVFSPNSGPIVTDGEVDKRGAIDESHPEGVLINGFNDLERDKDGIWIPGMNKSDKAGDQKGSLVIDDDVLSTLEYELGGNPEATAHSSGFAGVHQSKSGKQRAISVFLKTVLHETVHYGRNRSGAGNKGGFGSTEYGFKMEDEAYGMREARYGKKDIKTTYEDDK